MSELDSSGSSQGPKIGYLQYRDEFWGEEFLDHLIDYELLKKDSVMRSKLATGSLLCKYIYARKVAGHGHVVQKSCHRCNKTQNYRRLVLLRAPGTSVPIMLPYHNCKLLQRAISELLQRTRETKLFPTATLPETRNLHGNCTSTVNKQAAI